MDKKTLRSEMKARRAAVPERERVRAEERALDRLLSCGLLGGVREIFLYNAFGDEFRTEGIKTWLLRHHYGVSVPAVEGREMLAVRVSADTEYERDAFGIGTPRERIPVDKHAISLALVPGLAFDRHGFRIGYGGGYYDRFLADSAAVRVGLCYEFQITEEVPREPHDLAMDWILTEQAIYRSE